MGTRIAVSDYIAEPEWTRPLIEDEWRLVFESKLEIFQCIGVNGMLRTNSLDFLLKFQIIGLLLNARVLRDWNDDRLILQASRGEKRSYDEMMDGDDKPVQIGRGSDERPLHIESVMQVNIKKFRMTGMNYRV